MVGNSLALVGICSMIVSAVLVGPTVKRLGERRTLFAGLLCGALGFALFGWAPTTAVFLVAIPINCLWGLAGPASQSMMTQQVSPSEQGELQGAIGSVRSLAMLFGPGIFAFTFATFIAPERTVPLPAAPWYLAAVFLLVATVVAWVVAPRRRAGLAPEAATATKPA
jgi:DHA1 family tetracycline resistance protein-like MFS transporter